MTRHRFAWLRWSLAILSGVQLAACASQIDEAPASIETLQILRNQNVPLMTVGAFTPASKAIGRSVTIRLSTMHAPKGQDFAGFLGSTFEAELRVAGKLDRGAPLRLEGTLTESYVRENMNAGEAALGATITLVRDGLQVFSKPYRVQRAWDSDFIGAIAIPDAFREYNALYPLLVRQVLSDPEFVAAAKQ